MARKLPEEFLKRISEVKGKRARTVVQHILEHGFITTEELNDTYGYDHPPRAVRDVREQGIPIETFKTSGKHGRKIAAYRFADLGKIRSGRHAGRSVFSKEFKQALILRDRARCAICSHVLEDRYLQIDHRVPYEVAGDAPGKLNPDDFMLLCGSCNRAKSWSCEHCANWATEHDKQICQACYWGSPEKYTHIALRVIRRIDLVWSETEVAQYEKLVKLARASNEELPQFVKKILRSRTEDDL